MSSWPPKDWQKIVALVFSVGGAAALTALVWWGYAQLLPEKGWTGSSEGHRAGTLRWVLWIAIFAIGVVLVSLGMVLNPRKFRGRMGGAELDFEGGDPGAPPATPGQAARQVGEAAMDEAAAIEEATQ